MKEKPSRFQKYMTDRNISLVFRWWTAGAVYFFVGWGTTLGNQALIVDLIFFLGLAMGLFNIVILNPILRLMFNIGSKRPSHEDTPWQRISDYLVELLKNVFIVALVVLIYLVVNQLLILLLGLPESAVPLPGEPILFGVFYLLVFVLLEAIAKRIKRLIVSSRDRNK